MEENVFSTTELRNADLVEPEIPKVKKKKKVRMYNPFVVVSYREKEVEVEEEDKDNQ